MKELVFVSHLATKNEHIILKRVTGTDIYLEMVTKMGKRGPIKPAKIFWYHKDDPKTHATYEEAAKFKARKALR